MSLFNPSRDQARRFFFEAWRKHRERLPLTDLEALSADHIGAHPEYHALFDDAERHLERDWLPEMGETNPFLHLAMHLAISEQLGIDQPPGIRAAFEQLRAKLGDAHAAQHAIMDCLAEVIWQAQRQGTAPDNGRYLNCLKGKCGWATD